MSTTNETNYELYRNAGDEALAKLVKLMKEDSKDEKEMKLPQIVLNSAKSMMKEHNSHMHQTRSNKAFQLEVFREFGSEEQKEILRGKVRVEIKEENIVNLLS